MELCSLASYVDTYINDYFYAYIVTVECLSSDMWLPIGYTLYGITVLMSLVLK